MSKTSTAPAQVLTADDVRAIIREELATFHNAPSPEAWTIKQVCDYLHISAPTFHRLVGAGVLHPTKAGRRTLLDPAEDRGIVEAGTFVKFHHDKRK